MCPQFLQLRKSVVLTSNFAKSVVNLADMVRGDLGGICPWGLSPGEIFPWGGLSLGGIFSLVELSLGGICPWGLSLGRVNPQHLMGLSLWGFIPLHSQGIYALWAYSWREGLSPTLVGLSLRGLFPAAGGFVPREFVPSSWWFIPWGWPSAPAGLVP